MSGAVVAAGGVLAHRARMTCSLCEGNDGLMVDEEDLQEIAQPAGPQFRPQQRQKVPRIEEGLNHAEALSTEHGAVAGPPIPRVESQQDGPKSSGSITDSNTLMGPCEKPEAWPPTRLRGMPSGWWSQHAVLGHGTCGIFRRAFKQPAPLHFSERLRCLRSWHGHGLNSEVVSWKGWQDLKTTSPCNIRAEHPSGGRGLAMFRKTPASLA